MNRPATLAVLGAGNRGNAYGQYILEHPDDIRIVAVAEPREHMRQTYAQKHGISQQNQFESWEELLSHPRMADALLIATPDDNHVGAAQAAMKLGYTILMEKPMATSWEDTISIVKSAHETNSVVFVCHVLRYTAFYQKLKSLLDSGIIGQVRYVNHTEEVGYFHFAHSYVRGNWRNTAFAAPVVVAKSCHDMDILHWLLGKKCQKLWSSGSLSYFTAEHKPKNASDRCISCQVESECPYSACKIYLNTANIAWPVSVITSDLSHEGRYKALAEGPYGRCVFACDNNVPDVQTVGMQFEDHIEVNFSLTAFSSQITRQTKICGTHGEIWGDFEAGVLQVEVFGKEKETIKIPPDIGGHGGGDNRLMDAFTTLLKTGDQSVVSTSIANSTESHIMAFAAEHARQTGDVVHLGKMRNQVL